MDPGNGFKVTEFINEDNEWNFSILNQILNMDDLTDLSKIIILPNNSMEDIPCWVRTSNNMITIADHYGNYWKWLWKLKLPQKLKEFIWLVKSLLMNKDAQGFLPLFMP